MYDFDKFNEHVLSSLSGKGISHKKYQHIL